MGGGAAGGERVKDRCGKSLAGAFAVTAWSIPWENVPKCS